MPKKLVIGPWPHGPRGISEARISAYLHTLEVDGLRWFDYWLRGIENGILDEPPVTYALLEDQDKWSWKTVPRWPPADTAYCEFFLSSTISPSVESVNDGGLTTDRLALEGDTQVDQYEVDYAASTGRDNRWFSGGSVTAVIGYGDLRDKIDRHGATYTTEPLERALDVVGHPVLTLFATSDAPDLDFIAFLESVDEDGCSHYVTEGALRASHRVLGTPHWPYAGLPFTDSSSAVVEATPPLSDQVAELTFELYPIAIRFRKSQRLRLSLVHIDEGNTATPILTPTPHVTICRSSRYTSRIVLPLTRN